ncbi:hypothetical protein ACIBO4_30540 [Streptomyces sp. NPDC050149]
MTGPGAVVICVDCGQVITGAYVVVAHGDSMSGVRRELDVGRDLGRRQR